MTIALIAHDSKKELMVQFCTAYCRILSQHKLVATGTTGKMIAEATGLQVQRFLAGVQGGDQQIASRIACNEVDLLLFFRDPINAKPSEPNEMTLLRLCDVHNIPMPPTSPPLRCSSTAWSAATWIGVISSTRSSPCDHSINKKSKGSGSQDPEPFCVRQTLKSAAISCTSSGVKDPSGKMSRARISCGRAARASLSSWAGSSGG